MPELPEVEHARRRWLHLLGTEEILGADALDPIVVPQTRASFVNALLGRTIEGADRRGKNVIVGLAGEHALWFHLGMTGRVVDWRAGEEMPRFTRWWVKTRRGRIALADPRKLGRAIAGPIAEVREQSKIDRLGPDALELADPGALRARFGRATLPIKAALMDQERIAGIGNIHAAEALWLAKIHPDRPTASLSAREWSTLAAAIQRSLRSSIESMLEDQEIVYVESGGPNPFQVYDREGQLCSRCRRAAIVRETSRGRSTYLCPRCQRA